MSLTKKIFFALIAFSFLAASASAREAVKPTKELTAPRATTPSIEAYQPPPTASVKPKTTSQPGGRGGGEDGNRTTASYCADAYQGMADALLASVDKETIRFRNLGVMGETGSVNQELLCFLPDASPAIDDSVQLSLISGTGGYTNLGLCVNGYKDSAWRASCFHPSEIAGLKNEKKAALWDAGWTDANAISSSNPANSFINLSKEVPYILFDRFSIGDPMLLRALAGYEDIYKLMLSGERTWVCIDSTVGDFANRCRY